MFLSKEDVGSLSRVVGRMRWIQPQGNDVSVDDLAKSHEILRELIFDLVQEIDYQLDFGDDERIKELVAKACKVSGYATLAEVDRPDW